jgi:hypothetical protein
VIHRSFPLYHYTVSPLGYFLRNHANISRPRKHAFSNNRLLGRPSTAVTGSSGDVDEDPFEDWTKTTHERDSWATRERRRSNKFAKIDGDLAIQQYERSRSGRRASSALGIFSQGLDKNGNPIILSDDHHDEFDLPPLEKEKSAKKLRSPSIALAFSRPDDRRLSMSSENSDKRRGSILSLWKTGKDKDGRDHVHSGHEGEDWGDAISATSGTPPASPRLDDRGDRRGSILSIWKQGKDRDGKTVIHSGEEHDEIIIPLDEHGQPIPPPVKEVPERERVGSILSIWNQGKDKEGKIVIHSGEEHDGVIEYPVEKVESPKMRGQERRGSVLSMWTEDKRDTQDRPAPVVLKIHDEDDNEIEHED